MGGPPSRDQRRQSWYSCHQKIVGRNRIGHPYPWGEAWSFIMTGLYWSSYFPGLSGFHSFSITAKHWYMWNTDSCETLIPSVCDI